MGDGSKTRHWVLIRPSTAVGQLLWCLVYPVIALMWVLLALVHAVLGVIDRVRR
jgi:hypothetical protein